MDIIRKRKKITRLGDTGTRTKKGGIASSYISARTVPSATHAHGIFDSLNELELKRELRRIETSQNKKNTERAEIISRKRELEGMEEECKLDLITLFDERNALRPLYVKILSHVYRETHKYSTQQRTIREAVKVKREKEKVLSELLMGLQIRLIRNKKLLWEIRKAELRSKLHARLQTQDELSREIRILRAHKEHALLSLHATERNAELMKLGSRRRGKIISAMDLQVLSQHFKSLGKKKEFQEDVQAIEEKKFEQEKTRSSLAQQIEELHSIEARLLEEKSLLFTSLVKIQEEKRDLQKQKAKKKKVEFSWSSFSVKGLARALQPSFVVFSILALLLPSMLGAISYISKGVSAKSFVLGATSDALNAAKSASSDLTSNNLVDATANLNDAANAFSRSQKALESLGPVVDMAQNIPGLSKVSTARNLVDAAKNISLASAKLTQAADAYTSVGSVLPKEIAGESASQKQNETTFAEAITSTQGAVQEADTFMMQAYADLSKAKIEDIPTEYQEKLKPIFELFPAIATTFHTFSGFYAQLPTLLGVDQQRKYLLMFLNNNELRGPGGFLGSFGLMDVDQGKIENIKVFGTYDPDGQFLERIYPPAPLRIINPRWFMRDVFYPDFPTTAQKVTEFYEKSQGPSVDGVISFTPTIFENLLKVTGPVEVPEHHATVNADNFLEVTQYKVEIDYDKQLNQPKKFLGDMMPYLVQKMLALPQEKWLDVASVFVGALSQKHMQVYFSNQELEQKVKDAGIAGEIKDASKDYLNIVNNNILGNKTDLLITQNIEHSVEISADGTIVDEVAVTRTHTGTDAWPSGRNREFISLYVPKNSKLLSYTGFDTLEPTDVVQTCDQCVDDPLVKSFEAGKPFPTTGITTYDEFGKTVFAGWQYLDPGATKTYRVKYELPFKAKVSFIHPAQTYSLLLQKQAGSVDSKYRLKIHIASKNSFAGYIPKGLQDVAVVKSGDNLTFETRVTSDKLFGSVITR